MWAGKRIGADAIWGSILREQITLMPVEDAVGERGLPEEEEAEDGDKTPIVDPTTGRFCPPPRELLATSEKYGDALVRPAHELLCDYVTYKNGELPTDAEIEYLANVTGLPNSGVRAWRKWPIAVSGCRSC